MSERGEPFACLAAYDATTASLLERAGVHVLLMGDSAAQVVLGYDSTNKMPFGVAVELTAALKRGAPTCHVMADMPFGSYGVSESATLRNAMRLMNRGLADSVKLEVGERDVGMIERLADRGVPVCAHTGLRPTRAGLDGGYRAKGRTAEEASRIVREAVAFESAGAVLVLLEAVPPAVAQAVVERVSVPVIGIGCGPAPHGQILVVNDLLGTSAHPPSFAEPAADLAGAVVAAGATWVRRVADREVGGSTYGMPPDELAVFQKMLEVAS